MLIRHHLSVHNDIDPRRRFDRQADSKARVECPCVVTIANCRYDVTNWANAHPGGSEILRRYHGKDATDAFLAAHHSSQARATMSRFLIQSKESGGISRVATRPVSSDWTVKLFTREDPFNTHKILGLFCLIHFAYRYAQIFFGDPASGFGSKHSGGFSGFTTAMTFTLPHFLLSISSLQFRTVPTERVVGKPMIWKEFRLHNIVFGARSVVCTILSSYAIYRNNVQVYRNMAIYGSCFAVLCSNVAADVITHVLQPKYADSTTATMPYWPGCSVATQKRFKSFYAYSQFLATLACLSVSNPAWPFCTLLAIQIASFLMTLVRKGFISTKTYHVVYTLSLAAPYIVGLRSLAYTLDFIGVVCLGALLYHLRTYGVSKYVIWISVTLLRATVGDKLIETSIW